MRKQAFIVTGLGYGDEGKGSVVDWLTVQHNAHTVIRTGGPQALHRVVTSGGTEHVFSQFGSGTLHGAATHLSRYMLVAPDALLRESKVLEDKCEHDVFNRLTIHKDALLVTPVQAVTGRVRELVRGDNRRGSVGVGVGETVRDSEDPDAPVLYARDLTAMDLPRKLATLWQYKHAQYEHYADRASGLPEHIAHAVHAELFHITANDRLMEQTLSDFFRLQKPVNIVDDNYVAEQILNRGGTVICEGSQGVLLDRVHGFYPYTTKVRATPETAREILTAGHYSGSVHSLGVLRSYTTKHGHGPFVTEDATLTQALPDAANKTDPWQGNFRVGHFDAVAAQYAATVCGAGAIDSLVLTCLDRTSILPTWSICTAYQHEATALPDKGGSMMQHTEHLARLKKRNKSTLSDFLNQCQPVLQHIKKGRSSQSHRQMLQAQAIAEAVGIPVYAISAGETQRDKYKLTQPELV